MLNLDWNWERSHFHPALQIALTQPYPRQSKAEVKVAARASLEIQNR